MHFFMKSQKTSSSYNVLATNKQFKEMLTRQVSLSLEAEGYRYDGGYQWISPWENHSRRIIRVRLLKGAGGELSWGYCFDFIPILSNDLKSFHYERTDKSAGLQLFVWAQDLVSDTDWSAFRFSFFGTNFEDVERKLRQVYERSKPLGDAWFRSTQGAERILTEAIRQSQEKNCHWPNPVYIQAFLLSALGQPEAGLQTLNAWLVQEPKVTVELQEKLHQKLIQCSYVMITGTE